MGLTPNDKLNLIKDILNTHHFDGAASSSEYEQLYRSTKTMMELGEMVDYNNVIQAINSYSEEGMNLPGYYNDHLNTNKSNIQSWLQSLK